MFLKCSALLCKNVWWQHANLFDLLCLLYNVHDTGIDVIHYCCMDAVGWKQQEEGLKRACSLSVVGIRGMLKVHKHEIIWKFFFT
jgi:hypothetical protein